MSTFQVKNVQKLGFKKSNFVYNQDNCSTLRFGEVNPLSFQAVEVGDETHHYSFNTVVRLAPLVNPVFGRIMYKVTHHFVPLREIFPRVDSVLSELPQNLMRAHTVNGNAVLDVANNVSYSFPTMTLACLFACFIQSGRCTWRLCKRNGIGATTVLWLTDTTTLNNNALSYFFGGTSKFSSTNSFLDSSDLNNYTYVSFNLRDDGKADDTLTPDNSDFVSFATIGGDDYMLMLKLTKTGRRLFKILNGLGYRLSFTDTTDCNILPLFAYYKAWFDQYAISQYQNYGDTACSKICSLLNERETMYAYGLATSYPDDPFVPLFKLFLDQLERDTYYTDNVDFISACLPADGSLPSVNGLLQSLDGILQYPSNSSGTFGVTTANTVLDINQNNSENIAGPTADASNPLDYISIELLKRLYISQHSNASVGNDIAARLRAKGFSSFVDEVDSKFIGQFSFPIKVSDVDSTVDNYDASTDSGKPLGAYAGKGLAFRVGDNFTFQAREFGYIISMCVIYPITKSVNALPAYLKSKNRYTWFNAEYDGLSFEEISRNMVGHLTGTEYALSTVTELQRFGFLPRYTSKKTSLSNILNGGFAIRSERNFWLPYSLDRVVVENENPAYDVAYAQNSSGSGYNTFRTDDSASDATYMPTAGYDWRIIGNEPWKGNYDRIFTLADIAQNASAYPSVALRQFANPLSDNFVVQTEIEHNAYIGMLPVEDTWQTQDDEKPHMNIAKNQ